MLGASAGFAIMATFVGLARRHDPNLSAVVASFARALVNLVLLLVLAWSRPVILLGDGRWSLWGRGLFGAVSLLSYFYALNLVGIGEAAFLNNTSTFWVAALAPFFLHERTRPATWFAIAGSMVGMALLAHPRADPDAGLGRAAGLLSGVCAASAYLTVRRASATNPPIAIVFYFTVVSTVLSLVGALAMHSPWPTDRWVWMLLAGSGVAATFSQLAMTQAYRLAPAAPVAATGAAGPLLTTLLGIVVLNQVPDAMGMAGMAVLFVAAVVLPIVNR